MPRPPLRVRMTKSENSNKAMMLRTREGLIAPSGQICLVVNKHWDIVGK